MSTTGRPRAMKIVGACEWCNAPIYGLRSVTQGDDLRSRFSCDCYPQLLARLVALADQAEAEARIKERGFE